MRKALGPSADELLTDAREEMFELGEIVYEMKDAPPLILIATGLVRVYCTSSQGRQATLRYAVPGHVVGLPLVLAPETMAGDKFAVQALSSCRVLHFSSRTFKRVAQSNVQNMWPLFHELAESLVAGQHLLSQNLFQPIRVRVARHLLDLSEMRGTGLVVAASQQDIADAIGSVREVISRAIVQLRDEGLIRREEGVYVIVDPARLHAVSEQE